MAPAAASAKPTQTDKQNAAKECKAERGSTDATREAFRAKYGKKGNGIGKCVSQKAKENKAEADAEDAAEADARKNAAKQCDEERGDSDASRAAFAEKYGTNASKRNAFGKCVSQKAKEQAPVA